MTSVHVDFVLYYSIVGYLSLQIRLGPDGNTLKLVRKNDISFVETGVNIDLNLKRTLYPVYALLIYLCLS